MGNKVCWWGPKALIKLSLSLYVIILILKFEDLSIGLRYV